MTKKDDAGQVTVLNSRDVAELEFAHGKARMLAIGVAKYSVASGFGNLNVCSHDAINVKNRFCDIKQLHADSSFCVACTSEHGTSPTRGEILRLLNELSDEAEPADRLIFFYSGHGVRLGEEFYLVPQDAYSSTDLDALIAFSRVKEILNRSVAKQKLVILDACFSGPDVTNLKALPATLSAKFMKEYLANTSGTAVLSSSGISQTSNARSPNPKLSLLTYYLCIALTGEHEALDGGRLTLSSLYDYLSIMVSRQSKSYHQVQRPALSQAVGGEIVLADFTVGLIVPAGVDFSGHPLQRVAFAEREKGQVTDVLRSIKRWNYTQEYLATKVNDNIMEAFEDRFGVYAARLSEDAGIPFGEIVVGGNGVEFPDGCYSVKYMAADKKTGVFRHSVSFGPSWFDQPDRMILVLSCFDLKPREMKLVLSEKQSLESMIAGLKSRSWKLESNQLPERFSASHDRYKIVVTEKSVTFSGFSPSEILGSESTPEKTALVGSILSLLGTGNSS